MMNKATPMVKTPLSADSQRPIRVVPEAKMAGAVGRNRSATNMIAD